MAETDRGGSPRDWAITVIALLFSGAVFLFIGWVFAHLFFPNSFRAMPPAKAPSFDCVVSAIAPDTSAFAYMLQTRRYSHKANAFGWYERTVNSGRIDVYVYDLRRREGPRHVVGWALEGVSERASIDSFDGTHLVVTSPGYAGLTRDTVDVGTGARRTSPVDPSWIGRPYAAGGGPDLSGLHVLEETGMFFLRGTPPRHDEFLYEHAAVAESARTAEGAAAIERARRERALRCAQQQIVDVIVQEERRRIRVVVQTWCPRPDSLARRYRATFTLAGPIDPGASDPTHNNPQVLLRDVTLGPGHERFEQEFSHQELARHIPASERALVWEGQWQTAIGVRLVALGPDGSPDPHAPRSGGSAGVIIRMPTDAGR